MTDRYRVAGGLLFKSAIFGVVAAAALASCAEPDEPVRAAESALTDFESAEPSSGGTVVGRFSRWCGKVNIHRSSATSWAPDSDCMSGCNVGGLAYCQKFWPAATSVRPVGVTAKPNDVWTNAGCAPIVDDTDGADEFECVNDNEPAVGCGDGVCGLDEDFLWCPADCGAGSACGDHQCNNGETGASCASDCSALSVVVNATFPGGVLQFASEESFNALYHAISEDPTAAGTLPSFAHLKSYLSQFPTTEISYDVDQAEYLRDLKRHVVDDDALQHLVNPDLEVIAGGRLYQFTDIGLFRVDADKIAWFKQWKSAHQQSIDFDPSYQTVPGEVALGEGQYQVAPGVIRIDTGGEKMAGSDEPPILDSHFVVDDIGGSGGGPPGGGGGCTPSAPVYDNHTVGSGFNKTATKEFGNRRFVFKTKKLNLYLYRSIYIKGKLQRRKRALFVKYWGPSYADEIIVGADNLDLHTDYVFPTPLTYTVQQPKFKGISWFKLGNWAFDVVNIDVHANLLGVPLSQQQLNSFVNSQFNQFVSGQVTNLWKTIENSVLNAIDGTYVSRFAAYTKKINSLKEQNHVRWSFGFTEKPRGYSHENHWQFNWNIAIRQKTYKYDMRAGSFFGRARVGCEWHGIRIVRQ